MIQFNLGLLGAALAGGVKGAGRGMTKIADDETERLKQERLQEFKLRENEQQSKLQMDQVRQTADIADKSMDKRQDRGLLDYAAKKKIDIGMATDPNNVKAATDAELQAQRAKDRYSDQRFPTELSQKKQEFEIKNPLAKEKIQSELDQNKAQIEHWASYDTAVNNKADIDALKIANEQIEKKLETVSAMPEDSDAEKLAKNKAMIEVNQEMADLRAVIAEKTGLPMTQTTGGAINAEAIIQKVLGEQPKEQEVLPTEKPKGMVKTVDSLGDRINKWTLENDPREFVGNKIDEFKKDREATQKNKSRYTGH